MFPSLDDPSARDPARVGTKAAALAQARSAGVPVLPGFVVDGAASLPHLRLGVETLGARGSGGARLAVSGTPIQFVDALMAAGASLGDRLVARSSTMLDAAGEWSGAFSSYVDIAPPELPKAVTGCWASVFTVAALERQEVAGIDPGSFAVSVLVQEAVQPDAGGWAELSADGTIVVYGTKGSPAPLLGGWDTGHRARHDGRWSGEELIELVGVGVLDEVREMMSSVASSSGANRCEWAVTDRLWVLQLGRSSEVSPDHGRLPALPDAGDLIPAVEVIVTAPGRLGEEMVLPWAIGGLAPEIWPAGPAVSMEEIRQLAGELTAEVWGMPVSVARREARRLLVELRGGDPWRGVARIRSLRRPDPQRASRLLASLGSLRSEMARRGVVGDEQDAWHLGLGAIESALQGLPVSIPPRLGIGHWEPLVASVLLSAAPNRHGTPASPGIGAGVRAEVDKPHERHPGRRRVVTASHPLPNLAALVWDAAGLVTRSGSPAAHLFEAARALRVPAVCGVEMEPAPGEVVAVDGTAGTVATLRLERKL